jgi:uncharacterized membrane protein YsdA (DUF1294 family)
MLVYMWDDDRDRNPWRRRPTDRFVMVGLITGLLIGGLVGAALFRVPGFIIGDVVGGTLGAVIGMLVRRATENHPEK